MGFRLMNYSNSILHINSSYSRCKWLRNGQWLVNFWCCSSTELSRYMWKLFIFCQISTSANIFTYFSCKNISKMDLLVADGQDWAIYQLSGSAEAWDQLAKQNCSVFLRSTEYFLLIFYYTSFWMVISDFRLIFSFYYTVSAAPWLFVLPQKVPDRS